MSESVGGVPSLAPWLSVIGIGEDGLDGVSLFARQLLEDADHIIGGERHLAMLPSGYGAKLHSWLKPFADNFELVASLRGKAVVVLASGDPMHCGIGGSLMRHFSLSDMRILPHISSYNLAASRVGWKIEACELLTIHGRDANSLRAFFQPRHKLLILSKDATSPELIADMLCEIGAGDAQLHVLEHMGGKSETSIETSAHALSKAEGAHLFRDLNVVAVQMPDTLPVWQSMVAGLPDDAFEHDGKLTKRDIRASALAKLRPAPDALLWDIGCGCGSIAIEWLRQDASLKAIGLEPLAKRRTMALHNAQMLGVPRLELIDAVAPEGLDGLPAPDAIFIGGGLSQSVLEPSLSALKAGGRLVAHAVTLESEQVLLKAYQDFGGELIRLSVARAVPVGSFHGWKSAMPVTQWVWEKPLTVPSDGMSLPIMEKDKTE